MERLTRFAALLALTATVVACQPMRDQKDEAVHSVAAGLISTVIEAQSADANPEDFEPAKLTDCEEPCDMWDVAPVEACSLTADPKVIAAQKRTARQKA